MEAEAGTVNVRVGVSAEVSFSRVGIEKVFLDSRTPGKVRFEVSHLSGAPVPSLPLGRVYRFFDLSSSLRAGDVSGGKIRFRVEAAWLQESAAAPGDVRLYRYSEEAWASLPTRWVPETEGDLLFEAETPGFSYFAVATEERKAAAVPPAPSETAPPSPQPTPSNPPLPSPPVGTPPPAPSFPWATAAVLAAAAGLGVFVWVRRPRPGERGPGTTTAPPAPQPDMPRPDPAPRLPTLSKIPRLLRNPGDAEDVLRRGRASIRPDPNPPAEDVLRRGRASHTFDRRLQASLRRRLDGLARQDSRFRLEEARNLTEAPRGPEDLSRAREFLERLERSRERLGEAEKEQHDVEERLVRLSARLADREISGEAYTRAALPLEARREELRRSVDALRKDLYGATEAPEDGTLLEDRSRIVGATCPYCGDLIKAPQVGVIRVCPECRVPHHISCWEANGGCTTIACGEAPKKG
ncbi:MAG: PGF-pre-PGF domain-containing protein [Euryarchaeota archaeon]|nr:PGF-pre-PGF domain-containing protein [Euryarchaeota archaeon]